MFTLLGGVLGFMGSAFPEILALFKNNQSNKHQISLMEKQLLAQENKVKLDLEIMQNKASLEESKSLYKFASQTSNIKWITALQSSVRPIITYAFFMLFASVKISYIYILIYSQNIPIESALIMIWDEETQALFSTIIAFWFGQRALLKIRSSSNS